MSKKLLLPTKSHVGKPLRYFNARRFENIEFSQPIADDGFQVSAIYYDHSGNEQTSVLEQDKDYTISRDDSANMVQIVIVGTHTLIEIDLVSPIVNLKEFESSHYSDPNTVQHLTVTSPAMEFTLRRTKLVLSYVHAIHPNQIAFYRCTYSNLGRFEKMLTQGKDYEVVVLARGRIAFHFPESCLGSMEVKSIVIASQRDNVVNPHLVKAPLFTFKRDAVEMIVDLESRDVVVEFPENVDHRKFVVGRCEQREQGTSYVFDFKYDVFPFGDNKVLYRFKESGIKIVFVNFDKHFERFDI